MPTPSAGSAEQGETRKTTLLMVSVSNHESVNVDIAGIILAAGRSERMGRPKALLAFLNQDSGDSRTFIEHEVALLARLHIADIVVVANSDTSIDIKKLCIEATVVTNQRPEDGMISSINIAWRELCRIRADRKCAPPERVLVTLVDIPEIDPTVIKGLCEAVVPTDTLMVLPRYDDGQGHPVLLLREVFDKLKDDLPRGLKTIIETSPHQIREVIFSGLQPWDVDTPADYARFRPGGGTFPR